MPERKPHPYRYLILYKPYAVLSAFTDLASRATLADYVPVPDVYAAGRLDRDSEGLLFLTNDGWLAHRLTHPRHKQPKTYLVQVERISPGYSDLSRISSSDNVLLTYAMKPQPASKDNGVNNSVDTVVHASKFPSSPWLNRQGYDATL